MNTTRRQLNLGLAASSLFWVSACDRTAPTDLSNLRIADVAPLEEWDDCLVALRLKVGLILRSPVDGQTLAAQAHVRNADIAQSVNAALGSDWRPADSTVINVFPHIDTMVWETTRGPQRYYGLALMREVLTSTTRRQLRPLMSVFTRA